MSIQITLTAYNLAAPDAEFEAEYDAWASFVVAHVCDALGLDEVEVAQAPSDACMESDRVQGGTAQQRQAVREWLAYDGWEQFCASTGGVA